MMITAMFQKEMAVQNAHFLKQKSRNRDMKIFGGSDRPLNGGPPAFFTNIHGKEGLGPIHPKGKVTKRRNGEFF